ncbi:probable serine/threonine-protein kinase tsuA [Galendromus occidentalis]|uniref:non-specific serine/threonine protein kinase n=1 Tax=Galendromus occidentalis TaxID=34638 RepID=A0AAJ6QPB8_9ACAR|nr:probable serine/threonine-protein kinase tsuA [Galendromus occidentalis]
MAAMEEQRFEFTVVRNQPLKPSRKTLPVYDKLNRAERYYQVLANEDLKQLKRVEAALRDVKGVAKSRLTVRFDSQTSAAIFGENHDSLQTLIQLYRPRTLPPCLVKNYIAQICAICIDLHDRNLVLQGALQLGSFAKEATDHVFLMSSFGVQSASDWNSKKACPLYIAPELIRSLSSLSTTKLTPCDMFAADAYSVGLCGLMLATGRSPFTLPYTKSFTAKNLLEAKLRHNPEIPDDLDNELRCLLVHLLERSPRKRMTMHEAVQHPALRCHTDLYLGLSPQGKSAAISEGCVRRCGTSDPSVQTQVDTSYAMEAKTFTRSPTPPLLALDPSAEPFCLWLNEPLGDIDDKSSSSENNNDENNNGRSDL